MDVTKKTHDSREETDVRVQVLEAELKRRDEELTRLYSSLIQGLETPLSISREFLVMVLQGLGGDLSEDTQSYLGQVEKQCARVMACLEGLQEWWRLRDPSHRLEVAERSAYELVQGCVSRLESHAQAAGVVLAREIQEGLPSICVHEETFGRSIHTLIENAIRVAPAGTDVTIRMYSSDEHVVVEVEDRGVGIPESDRESVFLPFERPGGGIGLGLALARESLRKQGGEIEIQDARPVGLCVSVRVPLRSIDGCGTTGTRDTGRDRPAT